MYTIEFTRDDAIEQTVHNLILAGVLNGYAYDEIHNYHLHLYTLDPKDLLAVLLESWQLRDDADGKDYYFIDTENMNLN